MQEAVYWCCDFPAPDSCKSHVSILKQIVIRCHIRKLCLHIIEHDMKCGELTIVDQHGAHLLRAYTNPRHRLRVEAVRIDTDGEEKDMDIVPRSAAALTRIVSRYPHGCYIIVYVRYLRAPAGY